MTSTATKIRSEYSPAIALSYSFLIVCCTLLVAACNTQIYLKDGVTDGDTFYLSPQAMLDDNPVTQAWVSYSLTRSACQLQLESDNPARATSFNCELIARQHLIETWQEFTVQTTEDNQYLNELVQVNKAGLMPEYVARYFAQSHWIYPDSLHKQAFNEWAKLHLREHKTETRWVGSWNYKEQVDAAW